MVSSFQTKFMEITCHFKTNAQMIVLIDVIRCFFIPTPSSQFKSLHYTVYKQWGKRLFTVKLYIKSRTCNWIFACVNEKSWRGMQVQKNSIPYWSFENEVQTVSILRSKALTVFIPSKKIEQVFLKHISKILTISRNTSIQVE